MAKYIDADKLLTNYCPNCGADMGGDKRDGKKKNIL